MGCSSMRCVESCTWVNKKCMGIQESLLPLKNFKCKSCQAVVHKGPEKKVNLDGDTLEVVEKSCYFVDILSSQEKVHDSVVFRIRTGWHKFKELSSILCGRGLSQNNERQSP